MKRISLFLVVALFLIGPQQSWGDYIYTYDTEAFDIGTELSFISPTILNTNTNINANDLFDVSIGDPNYRIVSVEVEPSYYHDPFLNDPFDEKPYIKVFYDRNNDNDDDWDLFIMTYLYGEPFNHIGVYTNNSGTILTISAVPEPATMLLLGSGLIGLWGFRRKFRN